jgi:hypothetical protein
MYRAMTDMFQNMMGMFHDNRGIYQYMAYMFQDMRDIY